MSNMVEIMIDGNKYLIDKQCYDVNGGDIEGIISGRLKYDIINVKDRIVIDIGAGCGDTAIYYIVKGARLVYAIEPNPVIFRALIRTIEANMFGDRIIPMAVALSDRDDIVKVNPNVYGMFYEQFNIRDNGNYEVELMTYDTLKYLLIHDGMEYVLKSDCEGCEQYLLGKDLRIFNEILIEYHSEYLREEFEKQLIEQGFRIKIIDIFGSRQVGLIYGVRDK